MNKQKKYSLLVGGLLVALMFGIYSCIDPLDVEPQEQRRILVVEGGITTEYGPHRIRLQQSAQYGSRAVDEVILVDGATVFVKGDNDSQVFLSREKAGSYLTPSTFRAEVGVSYTLYINLASGERYASVPEMVVPVPEIKEIVPVFKKQPTNATFNFPLGVEIYCTWQDEPGVANYYYWETKGEYIIHTRPDLFVQRGPFGGFPAPKDCCTPCYVKEGEVNTRIRLFKDNFSDGNENTELVAYIQDDGKRWSEKYMAVIEQSSLTKEAFQFFNILKNQLDIDGDIFDPPTATIRGNIISLDNPDESTIGHFRASDVDRDTIFIERGFLTETFPLVSVNDDCRVLQNSSVDQPSYWQ